MRGLGRPNHNGLHIPTRHLQKSEHRLHNGASSQIPEASRRGLVLAHRCVCGAFSKSKKRHPVKNTNPPRKLHDVYIDFLTWVSVTVPVRLRCVCGGTSVAPVRLRQVCGHHPPDPTPTQPPCSIPPHRPWHRPSAAQKQLCILSRPQCLNPWPRGPHTPPYIYR